MASTCFWMFSVALFVVAFSALEAMQWDGGPADKANITACVGGITSIPWSFVKGDGETLLSLAWWFKAPGKEKTQIATSINGHFYTTRKGNLTFLPNAGLSLRDARPQDSGDYSVQVGLLRENSTPVIVERTATLSVTDKPPATQDGDLHVTLSDVVRDDVREGWTVPLYCGHFVDLGHPPVGVVWTTPSGEVKNSRYEDKGKFILPVSSSVQGGNYSCRLPPSAPAVRCLAATSPLKAAAQLYVDDKNVRLTLLEAELRETKVQLQSFNRIAVSALPGLSSCQDWLARDLRSGVRAIQASGQVMAVYCDQVTDHGGWTVFQRRKDASVDFNRGWTDFRNGFGDLDGSFWLGLDKLHSLTTSQRFELRVDLRKFDGSKGYAIYSGFYVDDASHNFVLHLDNFTEGSAGDSMSSQRGHQFSTKDAKHHTGSYRNCAQAFHGAWWFKEYQPCYTARLNGDYKPSRIVYQQEGISWYTFGSSSISLKFTEMKIRPM